MGGLAVVMARPVYRLADRRAINCSLDPTEQIPHLTRIKTDSNIYCTHLVYHMKCVVKSNQLKYF